MKKEEEEKEKEEDPGGTQHLWLKINKYIWICNILGNSKFHNE